MRHLRALNLVSKHRNLRLFDTQRISRQRSGLFVRAWRAYGGSLYVAHALQNYECPQLLIPIFVA